MSASLAAAIFFASGAYAVQIARKKAELFGGLCTISDLVMSTFKTFFSSLLIYSLASLAIMFGFSKKLSREIDFFDWSGYRGTINHEPFLFLLIIAIPLACHYAMCLIPSADYNDSSK